MYDVPPCGIYGGAPNRGWVTRGSLSPEGVTATAVSGGAGRSTGNGAVGSGARTLTTEETPKRTGRKSVCLPPERAGSFSTRRRSCPCTRGCGGAPTARWLGHKRCECTEHGRQGGFPHTGDGWSREGQCTHRTRRLRWLQIRHTQNVGSKYPVGRNR